MAQEDEELAQLMTGSRWGIGDGDFQAWIRDMHTELVQGVEKKEDISFRREEPRVEADTVLRAVAEAFTMEVAALRKRRYACIARPVAALLLGRLAGMNQRDIGAFLCIGTGAAVCQQLKRLREQMEHAPHLAQRVNEIMLPAKAGKRPLKSLILNY